MHPTGVTRALDVGCGTVECSVPLLVAETTLLPGGAFFIVVVSVINVTLTAIKYCEAHTGLLLLPRGDAHGHFVEAGVLYAAQRSGTACNAPFTSLSTEFMGT
jgi:hypothetical protein